MKRLLVLLVLLSPFALWFLLPSVSAAGTPVSSMVTVSWELREGNAASGLVPRGSPLVMHPEYYDFKHEVIAEITSQVPVDIRNAWPFHTITLNEQGYKPEAEVRAELSSVLETLNRRRAEIALQEGLPAPLDFSLSTEAPAGITYEVYNGTVKCVHSYPVSLGGHPWTHSNAAVGATVDFRITLSWTSRVPG